MKHSVTIVPHDPNWARLFEQEREVIVHSMGGVALQIEHIGSTAIPDIVAKPILDIMVGVTTLSSVDEQVISALEKSGYIFRGDAGVPNRLFLKTEREGLTYHLHIAERTGDYWQEKLLFRDYLRNHRDAAKEYEQLKIELVKKYADDRSTYTDHKGPFVQEIVAKAQAEQETARSCTTPKSS